ncbi:hypothetical protein GXP70_07875 [Paenibacillus lycopersici]|uniref:Uncharacterized protein n=1 Tax=Paenibacillus lycopersici TaxID=2704462 RepID=A0A6C0G4P0_9BACL|nr:hypothetical protein [Paenibacillus lycopersici]QHT59875.1 hypothetical protein GXP70_07875 [Paenibacillus lycopersici]
MTEQYCLYDPRKPSSFIEIKPEDYQDVKVAKTSLQIFLYMEEKLNFVVERKGNNGNIIIEFSHSSSQC